MPTTARQQPPPRQDEDEPLVARADDSKYKPHPDGQYVWVCADIHDEGVKQYEWQGEKKSKREIRIVYQSEVLDEQNRPLEHSEWFTLSLSEKSNLRPFLEAWRGKAFTEDELKGFDVRKLLNANAYVQVGHKPKKNGDGMRAVIQSIMRVPKGVGTISVSPEFKRIRDRVKPGTNGTPPKATAPQSAPDEYDEPEEESVDDDGADLPF